MGDFITDPKHTTTPFLKIKCIEKTSIGWASIGQSNVFYKIRSLRKVNFNEEAPSYRTASNGFHWIAYCKNIGCSAAKQMVLIPWGFGTFRISEEAAWVGCPKCKSVHTLVIRNCGFVRCWWFIKAVFPDQSETVPKTISDGITMDSQLYTFKELDYKKSFISFIVRVDNLTHMEEKWVFDADEIMRLN